MNEQPQSPPLCVTMADFLPPEHHGALLDFALTHEAGFTPSTVDNTAIQHRSSLVHYDVSSIEDAFLRCVAVAYRQVVDVLGMERKTITQFECQLTAHNDGHFYKLHNDNGTPGTRSRALSYVYYFHREPKGFTGGDLQLFHSKVENGFYVADKTFEIVHPLNNRIVFFQSYHQHQVLPIACPSKAFADSRFTLNGWLRQD